MISALRQLAVSPMMEELTLVSSLNTAVSFPQSDTVALLVRKDLDFDVPRSLKPPLEEYLVVTETLKRLALRRGHFLFEVLETTDDSHALTAASVRRLDQQR